MKIYSATTTAPATFHSIENFDGEATLPAGTKVTAMELRVSRYHLNYRDGKGGTWDTTVPAELIELGDVVATVNGG